MRIGLVIGEIQPNTIGGGYTFQIAIIDALYRVASEHELYVYYASDEWAFKNTEKLTFINCTNEFEIQYKMKLFYRKKTKRGTSLATLAERDHLDFVYFLSPQYQSVNLPFIITVWDLGHRTIPCFPEVSYLGDNFKHREALFSHYIPRASIIVTGNAVGKKEICESYNIENNRVKTIAMPTPGYVYSLQEDNTILKRLALTPFLYMLYPAQFWAHKNHICLVKAMKLLKEKGSNLKMVFTGSDKGNMQYIKDIVSKYELEDSILFAGFVSREELIGLYKSAYALAYASYLGPDNIPPLEAMALECPVICSGIAGMKEQLGNAALFFAPDNEESFIQQVLLLKNTNTREILCENGKKLAEKCSIENYIKHVFSIIEGFIPIRECWEYKSRIVHK